FRGSDRCRGLGDDEHTLDARWPEQAFSPPADVERDGLISVSKGFRRDPVDAPLAPGSGIEVAALDGILNRAGAGVDEPPALIADIEQEHAIFFRVRRDAQAILTVIVGRTGTLKPVPAHRLDQYVADVPADGFGTDLALDGLYVG